MRFFPGMAFLSGSVGTGEWIILFVVVLIVVGPKRLPEIARKLGRTMELFRRAADEFKDQLMNMDQKPSSGGAASSSAADVAGSGAGGQSDAHPDEGAYPGYDGYDGYMGDQDQQAHSVAGSVDETGQASVEGSEMPTEPTPEDRPAGGSA